MVQPRSKSMNLSTNSPTGVTFIRMQRASLHKIAKLLGSSRVPKSFTQEPFDHDPSHYRRLCNLQGSQPAGPDLYDFALDMTYMELQPDLLRHLIPVLLTAWRRDLFEGEKAGFRGFVEQLWPALVKGKAFQVLTQSERAAIKDYMADSILDRLDVEHSLTFSGMRASPYAWVRALVSYGVLFADIESLWTEWWAMKTQGHAVAAFQYSSALLYENDKNPIFAPWTRDQGGGPLVLWACDGHMFDVGWRKENLSFLRRTLTVEYIERNLQTALGQIQIESSKDTARRIIRELPSQRTLLGLRVEELPRLLADVSQLQDFTV
jgi:hypothetical protein